MTPEAPRNEEETRKNLIDEKLRLAGWNVKDTSQVIDEFDIDLAQSGASKASDPQSPYEGHQFVDYVLLLHGNPVAVVEGKKPGNTLNK